jgi:hypothetical protein
VYWSLDQIDILAEREKGGPIQIVLTDHRERAQIDEEPEISVLFAMTRVIASRHTMTSDGRAIERVVYKAKHALPPYLVEALRSVDAAIEQPESFEGPANGAATAAIVERAFDALADRVARRTGLTDPAAVLRVLEAETTSTPIRREGDEGAYWTRILELMAVTGRVMRAARDVAWVVSTQTTVPFGLEIAEANVALPYNRALRFIESGESESMFLLIASVDEMARPDEARPIMPSLRDRAEAVRGGYLCSGLIDDPRAPVIAYGRDGEKTFALFTRAKSGVDLDDVTEPALLNIAAHEVDWVEGDLDGVHVAIVDGDWFASEKLLDEAFMRGVHEALDAECLAAGVPHRRCLVISSANDVDALARIVEREHDGAGARRICRHVLLVRDGRVVSVAGNREPPSEPTTKPRGFFARLFGRRR